MIKIGTNKSLDETCVNANYYQVVCAEKAGASAPSGGDRPNDRNPPPRSASADDLDQDPPVPGAVQHPGTEQEHDRSEPPGREVGGCTGLVAGEALAGALQLLLAVLLGRLGAFEGGLSRLGRCLCTGVGLLGFGERGLRGLERLLGPRELAALGGLVGDRLGALQVDLGALPLGVGDVDVVLERPALAVVLRTVAELQGLVRLVVVEVVQDALLELERVLRVLDRLVLEIEPRLVSGVELLLGLGQRLGGLLLSRLGVVESPLGAGFDGALVGQGGVGGRECRLSRCEDALESLDRIGLVLHLGVTVTDAPDAPDQPAVHEDGEHATDLERPEAHGATRSSDELDERAGHGEHEDGQDEEQDERQEEGAGLATAVDDQIDHRTHDHEQRDQPDPPADGRRVGDPDELVTGHAGGEQERPRDDEHAEDPEGPEHELGVRDSARVHERVDRTGQPLGLPGGALLLPLGRGAGGHEVPFVESETDGSSAFSA